MVGVPACRTEIERFERATPARRGVLYYLLYLRTRFLCKVYLLEAIRKFRLYLHLSCLVFLFLCCIGISWFLRGQCSTIHVR